MFLFRKLSSLKSQQHENSTVVDKVGDDVVAEDQHAVLAPQNDDKAPQAVPQPPQDDGIAHALRDEDRYELVRRGL